MNVKSRDNIKAEIYSTAPHFHLIDRGHVIKNAHGKEIGFKQGLYFVKKTADEESENITKYITKTLYRKLKGKIENG